MLTLKEYHDKYWLPTSTKLNNFLKKYKYLYLIKRIFDIHFKILGVLSIFATPKNDLDCYVYMFQRSKNPQYANFTFRQRLKKAWQILKIGLKK